MNSINELIDDVLWRELVQHLERRKSTVSYRRPIVDLKLHYVVTDKTNDGKIIKKSGIRNAHSLLANFLSALGQSFTSYWGLFANDGKILASQNASVGIMVGAGSQTKTVMVSDLNAVIKPSSTGLAYGAETFLGPTSINNGASAVLREIRTFTNNTTGSSASNYTLSEIGIYGNINYAGAWPTGFNKWTSSSVFGQYYALFAYDLLSPPVVVQPSQSVTFEYDWIVNV